MFISTMFQEMERADTWGSYYSANDHPAGMLYAKDVFARKVLFMVAGQVAINPASAFPIAAVALGEILTLVFVLRL